MNKSITAGGVSGGTAGEKQLNAWVAQGRQQVSAIERQQARLRRNQREQENYGC